MSAPEPVHASVAHDRVLDVVAGLVSELGAGATRRPSLDDSLDRDLGISSLERVELLLRLEQAFGVRLPDDVMADAATPLDLVTAILHAAPAGTEAAPTARDAAAPGMPAPATARTLVDALRWHAERTPDRVHIHLRNDDGTETPISYGALLAASMMVAGGLRRHGVAKGDRVALMLRTERAFFEAFVGTLLAGAVPVPLYPPVRAEDLLAYARRQQRILASAEPRVLVTFDEAAPLAALTRAHAPSLEAVTTVEDLRRKSVDMAPEHVGEDDPALIQYTSGSTGDPKGVLLSHANILANVRAFGEALAVGADDVAVSWLPLYHDMGLIGLWFGPLYFGVPVAIMSPLAFLARPSRWLRTLHAHRGTISAAPNFAFDLCARRIPDAELEGLDLSGWRVAINGSEPVAVDTLERFERRFAPFGFNANAMCPAYGLAESSVAMTLGALDRPARVDRLVRVPFERAREIRPAADNDTRAVQLVSCGRPLRDHEVRIVDAAGLEVAERVDGRVQFRGPSVTRGYFRNPAATRAAVDDGWMDSGDLGYRADGELFITGRRKDLIIQGGRNISADEVEAVASTVPGIRPHCVAAFGVPDPATGTERLVVVAETRERDPASREALERAVRDGVVSGIGSPPDVVLIVAPHTVLKTSSGKIRRSATRDAYVNGTLGASPSIVGQRVRLVAGAAAAWAGRFVDGLGRALFTAWLLLWLVVSVPVLWVYLAARRPGRHADRAARRWSRFTLGFCGVRLRVSGLEHLHALGSAVLVANHASYIDPIVLMAALPLDFHFVAKRGLTRYPVIGAVIGKAGHLTIEKAGLSDRLAGADEVERRLRDGDRLLIFPEGTFRRPPGLLPFRLGAFRAAVETGRPVVPVAIAGTRRILPDGARLFRRGTIVVTISAPRHPAGDGWPEMVRLRDAALDAVARGSGEAASTYRVTG